MDEDDPLTVPEGTRLFYIGPPKTGTTSLQEAARGRRDLLRERGVYYPGTGRNHRAAIFAFLGVPEDVVDHVGGEPMPPGAPHAEAARVPPASEWTDLLAAVDTEPAKRVLITHEHAATASDGEAERFIRELGGEHIHVVMTLRPLSQILISRWIEDLKDGVAATLEEWLESYYDPSGELVPARTRRYLDQAGLIERWARVAGVDNLTVIVVDTADKDFLTETFERLLGLPARTLTGLVSDGYKTNRSMTLAEAQIFQHVNAAVMPRDKMSWPAYLTVVRRGACNELLKMRTPEVSEARVHLPRWAAERAERDGVEVAQRIAATGVRVVGDLERLHERPVSTDDQGEDPAPAAVIQDIAVQSLVGALRATTAYEKTLARRIDLARERRIEETERREKAQQLLKQEKAEHKKVARLLDQEKVRRAAAEKRLAQEQATHRETRATLTRVRARTIRDQVKGLSTQDRQHRAAESFTTHDLVRAVSIRLQHKVRTRRSLRLR